MKEHKLLQQQLKKYMDVDHLDQLPEEIKALLVAVNQTYHDASINMRELEKTVTDSSLEIYERDQKLDRDSEIRSQVEANLEKSEEELKAQKKLFENLVEIARTTTQRPTLEGTLRSTLAVSCRLTHAERGSLFILDESGSVTHSIRSDQLEIKMKGRDYTNLAMKKGLAGWVMDHREVAVIHDTEIDSRWAPAPAQAYQPRSVLCVPILHGRSLIGILTLTSPQKNQFSDEDIDLMKSAADQLALSLTNAQIYEQQVRLAERQWALYDFLQTLGGLLDLQQVTDTAVRSVVELTSWPVAVIFLVDKKKEKLEACAIAGDTELQVGQSMLVGQGIAGRTFRIGQTQYVANALEDADNIVLAGETAPRSELAVPLQRGQRGLGVLHIQGNRDNKLAPDDILMAELMADAIALAIDNALLYEQVFESKEQAEAANLAKTAFVSVASHELKTPMTVIGGFADLMARGMLGPLSTQQENALQMIVNNVQHMNTLVSDLTDISRIESGQLKLTIEELSVTELIEDVVASIRGPMQLKEQQLELFIEEQLPHVLGDRTRLVQILNNLVSNAYKYTPAKGKIILTAVLQESNMIDQDSAMVHIIVQDTGIGIKDEEQGKLFEQFFRSDDDKAQDEPGTGLGLNITKNLVEAQGGSIWFESVYRKGTSFHFTIPVSVVTVMENNELVDII